MTSKLTFRLYSREGDEIVRETSKVVFRNPEGEVCILPDHARYFTKVREGRMGLEDVEILTTDGYLVVKDNVVTVFVERAQDLSMVSEEELDEEIKELTSIPPHRITPIQKGRLEWLKKIKKELKERKEV